MLSKINQFNAQVIKNIALYGISLNNMSIKKEIKFDEDCHKRLLEGVEKITKAIQVTYGPKGRNVIIQSPFGTPKITKDGVTVAKHIDFEEKDLHLGAKLIKMVANKTNDEAGDGTTCASVLTYNILKEGIKSVTAGMNPMEIKKGIDLATEKIVEELKKTSIQIKSHDQIIDVATISANGDRQIGKLIADMIKKTGQYGTIYVQEGKTLKHETTFVEGMSFDRGMMSPYFMTDPKSQKCIYENPRILICETKISTIQQILPVIEYISEKNLPLLIIAEDIDTDPLATLLLNKLKGGLKICAVKPPMFGDHRKQALQDIAALTNGTVLSEDIGNFKLEKVNPETILGKCKKIEVTKDDTVIIDGVGSKQAIQERIEGIKLAIEKYTPGFDYDRLQERLAKLSSGVGVIKVGGASEIEIGEIKDRITDSINATKAAIDEGIVLGGGAALLKASKILANLKGENFDQTVGVGIISKAIQTPIQIIAENAGYDGKVVKVTVEENDSPNFGFNASNGTYVDMLKAGIIDPTKVIRSALTDSSSVASMMITSSCMIYDFDETKKKDYCENKCSCGCGGSGGCGCK